MRWWLWLFLPLFGTEHLPWLGETLEFEWRQSVGTATYPSIEADGGVIPGYRTDLFGEQSLSVAIFPYWGVEVEGSMALPAKGSFDTHHWAVTVRHPINNEATGSLITITPGFTYRNVAPAGRFTASSWGQVEHEYEGFLALGRELIRRDEWIARFWVVGLVGGGDDFFWKGYEAACELRLGQAHRVRVFAQGREATDVGRWVRVGGTAVRGGGYNASLIGGRYGHEFEGGQILSAEYSYQYEQRNFARHPHRLWLELLWPFGL